VYKQTVFSLTGSYFLLVSGKVVTLLQIYSLNPWTAWVMDRTIHRGFAGILVGSQVFTDLDFADDVAVLSEMLEILILSLEIMYYEALPFGLEINWDKTKIQGSDFNTANSNPASVSVLGNPVELVESFTYLGCRIDACGVSEDEILRRIEIARGYMKSLTKNIWRSSITQSVKIYDCIPMFYRFYCTALKCGM